MVSRRKNTNHCCVIGCHGYLLLYFGLNTKVSCEGLFFGGGAFWNIYISMIYAEFDSKIAYIMFLHDYHLACEISTVSTFAFRPLQIESGRASSARVPYLEQWVYTAGIQKERARILSEWSLYKLIVLMWLPACSLPARFRSVEVFKVSGPRVQIFCI